MNFGKKEKEKEDEQCDYDDGGEEVEKSTVVETARKATRTRRRRN